MSTFDPKSLAIGVLIGIGAVLGIGATVAPQPRGDCPWQVALASRSSIIAWRLNTGTGELEVCGTKQSIVPGCESMPSPADAPSLYRYHPSTEALVRDQGMVVLFPHGAMIECPPWTTMDTVENVSRSFWQDVSTAPQGTASKILPIPDPLTGCQNISGP